MFFLISLASLLWMASQNYAEFSHSEMAVLCVYALVIFIMQAALIGSLAWVEYKVKIARILSKGAAAIFTAFNVYTLVIVHNARFAGMDASLLTVFLAALVGVFSLLYFISNSTFRKFSKTFVVVLIVVMAVRAVPGFVGGERGGYIPEHFKIPVFKEKPNVYVITFDAISPEPVIRNNLGLLDLPYVNEVEKLGGRIIPNAFAERIPTKRSLNSFLAMDLDYYKEVKHPYRMLTGEVLSPVYESFRRNGYKIGFMYETSYFGGDVGALDYYGVARVEGICKHVEKSYSLLGYCFNPVQEAVSFFTKSKNSEYPKALFDHIAETGASDENWFTMAHVYQPGHAKNSFNAYKKEDWEEFRRYYEIRMNSVTNDIRSLVTTIRNNDPGAVLIIFGDHGGLTSVGLLGKDAGAIKEHALDFTEADMPQDSPMTYKQIVQDRHAVFMAVFAPAGFCEDGFKQNPFATMRAMREIFKCLSGGEDPLPQDYQPNDDKWVPYKYQ